MTTRTSTTCYSRWSRGALTLVEVIAAIAILGGILVGVVLATSRHTRQLAMSERRLEALRATDALISEWWTSADGLPIDRTGTIASRPSLEWRTRIVENQPIEELHARVLRVEVLESDPPSHRQDAAYDPLVVVDLVLPVVEEEDEEKDDPKQSLAEPERPRPDLRLGGDLES